MCFLYLAIRSLDWTYDLTDDPARYDLKIEERRERNEQKDMVLGLSN